MADVINLRLARKQRDRVAAERTAAQNRALHGRTKAQREAERLEAKKSRSALDGAKLDQVPDPDN